MATRKASKLIPNIVEVRHLIIATLGKNKMVGGKAANLRTTKGRYSLRCIKNNTDPNVIEYRTKYPTPQSNEAPTINHPMWARLLAVISITELLEDRPKKHP